MIVLDTHTWLWWIQGTATELPPKTKALIDQEPGPVGIASVSCLEVAWLAKKGRIVLPVSIEDFFTMAIDRAGLVLLPLTPLIAARSAALPDVHRDPIDRVIIATAIEHDAELVSKDELVSRYPGVRVRWDS
ncbi:type II toxin-antitoxin system VapC family toxin [Sorangium sp. So ce1153]|uniref:type II toxin-antitoxin system VapC family toxin n=1 Tax=Sorangium sp. So ce1153 TaxID=3133333 RepID=UPI003F62B2D2